MSFVENGKLIKWGVQEVSGGMCLQIPGEMELKMDVRKNRFWGVFPQLGRRCRGCLAGACFVQQKERPFSKATCFRDFCGNIENKLGHK